MSRVYHITFSLFGTRLPGARQGAYRWNGEVVRPDRSLLQHVERNMTQEEILLDRSERKVVFQAIVDCCRKHNWKLGALNVRSNHVHMLAIIPETSPEKAAATVKALATKRLKDFSERFRNIDKLWTRSSNSVPIRHGDLEHWKNEIHYSLLHQGDNSYLTKEEWLKFSAKWLANPFIDEQWYVMRFNGRILKWEERR